MPALSPAFSRANGLGREVFLQVLVTGIVTNLEQKIPSQITGKIMFKPTGHFHSYRLFTRKMLFYSYYIYSYYPVVIVGSILIVGSISILILTLIVGSILTLTLWTLLLTDFGSAYRRSVGK